MMFTLADLHFESDVREAMETLPEDIEAVYIHPSFNFSHLVLISYSRYERILTRLCGCGKTPNQRIAIRILQWMVVARRPLKRSELESGIILHGQVSKITTSNRPRGDVLSLCYPILDVEDDPASPVRFTHFTAQESVLRRCLVYRILTKFQVSTKNRQVLFTAAQRSPAHCFVIMRPLPAI